MRKRIGWPRRLCASLTATAVVMVQLSFPTQAEAALGSSTASAGSAPPPAISTVQSFQPDLFTGRKMSTGFSYSSRW